MGNCGFGSRQAVQCIYILPKLAQTPEKGTRRGQKKVCVGGGELQGCTKTEQRGVSEDVSKVGMGITL